MVSVGGIAHGFGAWWAYMAFGFEVHWGASCYGKHEPQIRIKYTAMKL